MDRPARDPDPPRAVAAARSRAPRRRGTRRQITVPDALWAAAEAMAPGWRTTPNDVVVQLAQAGLDDTQRREQIVAIAQQRRAAYAGMAPTEDVDAWAPQGVVDAAITAGRGTDADRVDSP